VIENEKQGYKCQLKNRDNVASWYPGDEELKSRNTEASG
jgi:hypothetical protein